MRLWNWLLTKLGKRFPLPPRHILTYEEIKKYWDSMSPRWQRQCSVIVLRIRKPIPNDQRPAIWRPGSPDNTWVPTKTEVLGMLGRNNEVNNPFTIRIDREWERLPGIKVKEEVCIANFEL
jgi:hypothetical protein